MVAPRPPGDPDHDHCACRAARGASAGPRGAVYLYEDWTSAEKLDAHLAAPHLVRFAGLLGDLVDDQGLSINRVRRIA